jgi:hypothetical protein
MNALRMASSHGSPTSCLYAPGGFSTPSLLPHGAPSMGKHGRLSPITRDDRFDAALYAALHVCRQFGYCPLAIG